MAQDSNEKCPPAAPLFVIFPVVRDPQLKCRCVMLDVDPTKQFELMHWHLEVPVVHSGTAQSQSIAQVGGFLCRFGLQMSPFCSTLARLALQVGGLIVPSHAGNVLR